MGRGISEAGTQYGGDGPRTDQARRSPSGALGARATHAAGQRSHSQQSTWRRRSESQAKAEAFLVLESPSEMLLFKQVSISPVWCQRPASGQRPRQHVPFQIRHVTEERKWFYFFRQKKGMGRKRDKHAVGGILCGGVTPSILTQARRRRATPFVRLVSSQVKKTEKWSGLAAKRLTSYCCTITRADETWAQRPAPQGRLSPVPRPTVSLTVTVWSAAGHAWSFMGQHAAGWFQRDAMRRCSQDGSPTEAKHGRLGILSACSRDHGTVSYKPACDSAPDKATPASSPASLCSFTFKTVPGSILLHANIYRVLRKSEDFSLKKKKLNL